VLVSIVIGFALTTLLGGAVRLTHRRKAVVWYWPSVVWMVTLLLIDVQVWWARFSWRNTPTWTFAVYFVTLLVPIGAYALSALMVAEPDETPIDLKKEYFGRRTAFFGILIATVAASYLPDILEWGNVGNPADAAMKAGIILINVPALFSANETLHKFLAALGLVVFCAYIATLFAAL
jgi:hypothetical protein